jgi:hypothetical protein
VPKVLIKNIGDATRKLSKIIRLYEQDEITTEKFRSLVYGLSKYIEGLYKYDVEQRLDSLDEEVRSKLEFK